MKILRIGGKNLASLAGEFCVDFEQEPLASTGLFAISGPTGAGKSTLLDALCLALYDDTPRLLKVAGRSMLADVGTETVSTQDTRTLLRRGTAEGFAQVDFIGNDGAPYRARWSVRRSRTRAEGALQPTVMSLHRLPALQAIGATKTEVKAEIERRIGLSFQQFTRAVLLAQNEFSAFLKSEDNERGELLETLTGSTIYSEISMRAFERAKLEQHNLQKLNARLADQKPLAAEQRAELEAQGAAAAAALHALEQRKADLEQELRWHQRADQLREEEQAAQQACTQAADAVQAAAPRRAALARLVAVQPARPLADAIGRIESDIAATEAAMAAAGTAISTADAQLQQAQGAQQHAALQLQAAEAAQRGAGPQLDQAKALDARVEAMLPAWRQASDAAQKAELAETTAKTALQAKQDERRRLESQLAAGAAWLAQHEHWQTLAQSWERWDVLFVQAGQAAAQAEKLANGLARVQHSARHHRDEEAAASDSLTRSAALLETLTARRQDATDTLAAYDAEQLRATRTAWQQHREVLVSGEKIWLELDARQQRAAQIAAQSTQLRAAITAAEQQLATARHENIAILAAFTQAERSLRLARAACGENVEKLRATLEDDTPCPVCGAHEHPYRHRDPAMQGMQGMIDSLEAEVTRCRRQMEDNVNRQATHRAAEQASLEQLNMLSIEANNVQQALDRAQAAWHAHPLLSPESEVQPPEASLRSAWFGDELAAARTALQAIDEQERTLHAARQARDQAQAAWEAAATENRRLQEVAAHARTALARANTEYQALDEQRIEVALTLSSLLSDLDPAFGGGDIPSDEWKDDWKSGPARFHAARQAESRQWRTQHEAHAERSAALATFDVEMQVLHDAVSKAGADAVGVRHTFAGADAALRATQDARMALWGGREVADVERALTAAIEQARAQLASREQAAQQAVQARVRADEAQAQAGKRLAALRAEAVAAADKLAGWLAGFVQRQRRDDATDRQDADAGDASCAGAMVQELDLAALHAMLALPQEDIDSERQALQAIDRSADNAATVLRERLHQRAQHEQSAPPLRSAIGAVTGADSVEPGASPELPSQMVLLAQALEALAAERKAAQDSAAAAHVALAQDDARRRQSSAVLAEIEQQEAIEQRWSRMSELIGSADGKKFRNYAQQFTLDVLLGYANAHLQHLSRRYQLERIEHTAAPSLALLVRDQDMGGEMRSVHSLSGGESFLVSLALALGLASLSSNRVRVESLFIDEGFGSLDAETLRVAMDALDGLQAMGRKVGVISHVQEMTERISTRILVQPAAGGRSTVSVVTA